VSASFRIPKRALIVFAHPDDAEFGCAGTIAAWTARGSRVSYCVLTSGNKGTHDPKMDPEKLASLREEEQRGAATELGVEECIFLRHDDGELEVSMALRGEVCLVIREQKPDLLITQDPWRPYQMHPDHRTAGWAGLDGLIAARDHLFFPHQLGPRLKHHRVKRALLFGTAEPNVWFDVSRTLARKLRALHRHRSQIPDPKGLDQRLREWARTQGQPWGLGYAEGFRHIELG
jgi:LmbE family N-acetylglucosaminyl deacetylase